MIQRGPVTAIIAQARTARATAMIFVPQAGIEPELPRKTTAMLWSIFTEPVNDSLYAGQPPGPFRLAVSSRCTK